MNNTSLKILISNQFQPTYSELKTNVCYRYFNTIEDANSFINIEAWFPGSSKNRLSYDIDRQDPNEYYNHTTWQDQNKTQLTRAEIWLGLIALSLTECEPHEWPNKNQYCVQIHDLKGYINALQNDLTNHLHKISWFNREWVLQRASELNVEAVLPLKGSNCNYNPQEANELLICEVIGIRARKIHYDSTALGKDLKFLDEREIRIELNKYCLLTELGENPEPALDHLIEYIKLATPSVHKYCTYLGNASEHMKI